MKRKLTILALLVGMVGALLGTAGVAFGGSGGWSAYDDIGRLDLNLNAAGDQFVFTQPGQPAITQTLSTAGCRINPSSGTLVSLSANGTAEPGLKDHVIGVRSAHGEGNGTPCARISNSSTSPNAEILTIEFTGSIAGYKADYAEIGLKLKFGATARIEAFDGARSVLSVPVPCTGGGGDCGADSGNDRKLVPIDPPGNLTFNRVVISIDTPSDGSASLIDAPGYQTYFNLAGDITAPTIALNDPQLDPLNLIVGDLFVDPGAVVNDNFDDDREILGSHDIPLNSDGEVTTPDKYTITYGPEYDSSGNGPVSATRSVEVFDGLLACGDTKSESNGDVTGTFTRLGVVGENADCEEIKPYNLIVETDGSGGTVTFRPEGSVVARYDGTVTFEPYAAANPVPQTLKYDPETDALEFRDMQWCTAVSFDTAGDISSAVLPAPTAADPLPSWCIVSSETSVGESSGQIQTTWRAYGEGDPRMSGA